jgi:hypothetical protein
MQIDRFLYTLVVMFLLCLLIIDRLNFGPPVNTPSTAKSPSGNCASSLEEKVGRLELGSKVMQ